MCPIRGGGTGRTRGACGVDGDTIAAVALSPRERSVHEEEGATGRLVEVHGTANAGEVPVEVRASADSLEVDVLVLWEERVAVCGGLLSCFCSR